MSIQTAPPQTAEQMHQNGVRARQRLLIHQKAASIRVTVIRNGTPTEVFLKSLPSDERAEAEQQLLYQIAEQQQPPAIRETPAATIPETAAVSSRFMARTEPRNMSRTKPKPPRKRKARP